jgi:hypothetical protein
MSPDTDSFGETIRIPEIRLYGTNVNPDSSGDAQVGGPDLHLQGLLIHLSRA